MYNHVIELKSCHRLKKSCPVYLGIMLALHSVNENRDKQGSLSLSTSLFPSPLTKSRKMPISPFPWVQYLCISSSICTSVFQGMVYWSSVSELLITWCMYLTCKFLNPRLIKPEFEGETQEPPLLVVVFSYGCIILFHFINKNLRIIGWKIFHSLF